MGQNPNWIQLPDSNATWCAQRGFLVTGNPDAFHTYNYIQTISGDTVINGLAYHKIYESGILEIMSIPPTTWTFSYYSNEYVGCIRENNNRQSFKIPSLSTSESILYDFNLQLGDTVPSTNDIIISGIDSIYDGSNYRLRYKLSSADSSFWPSPLYYEHVSWVEGIGSTGGTFFSLGPYFEHGGKLFEFTYNGIVFYQDTISTCGLTLNQNSLNTAAKTHIYPNPFFDKITVSLSTNYNSHSIFELYDIVGKRILDSRLYKDRNELDLEYLGSGIYIYRIMNEGKAILSGKLIKN